MLSTSSRAFYLVITLKRIIETLKKAYTIFPTLFAPFQPTAPAQYRHEVRKPHQRNNLPVPEAPLHKVSFISALDIPLTPHRNLPSQYIETPSHSTFLRPRLNPIP